MTGKYLQFIIIIITCVFLVLFQLLRDVLLFVNPETATCQASLSFTISWSLLQLMLIESMIPSSHLILCPPFLLLPSIFPSIRVFCNESALCIRWPKYWGWSHYFQSPLLPSSRGSLVSVHFLPLRRYHLHIWGYWYFSQQSWFQLVLHPTQRLAWCTLHTS